jgi:hypothetical protein
MRHGRLVDESPHVELVRQHGRCQLRLDLRQARQEATDARLALDRAVGAFVANHTTTLLARRLFLDHELEALSHSTDGGFIFLERGATVFVVASIPLPVEPAHGRLPEAITHVERNAHIVGERGRPAYPMHGLCCAVEGGK